MDQIMRLRRAAGAEEIVDKNNGHNHELAFTKIIQKKGTLDESLLLQESYAPGVKGKLIPRAAALKGLFGSLPTAVRGLRSGKMRSLAKLMPGVHPKLPGDAQDQVKRVYEHAEEHRTELNLYVVGEEAEEPEPDEETPDELAAEGAAAASERQAEQGTPDDSMGGAATPTQAPAVGGGRQHEEQATEGGSETARTEATNDDAEREGG
jgi:succinate dehydrogenase / fumarate reductase iron-sulfur subunit